MIISRCVQLKGSYTVALWVLLENYMIHTFALTSAWVEAHDFDQQCQFLVRSWFDSYIYMSTLVEVWLKFG